MLGNKTEFWDYLDLLLLKLAKRGRAKLTTGFSGMEFYNEFFTNNDIEVLHSGIDRRRVYRASVLRDVFGRYVRLSAIVLDVGCGVGDNLRSILRDDLHICGIEYSPAAARVAREMLPSTVKVQVGSAMQLPFASGSLDVVLCIEVLEHISDQYSALREIYRILNTKGHLILSVPYRRWFPAYFTLMGHFRHYTRTDLSKLLQDHGFEILEYLPNFPKWSRYANYCYVFCRIIGRLLKRGPLDVYVPLTRHRLLGVLYNWIEPIYSRDATINYSELQSSTFVLARKC